MAYGVPLSDSVFEIIVMLTNKTMPIRHFPNGIAFLIKV